MKYKNKNSNFFNKVDKQNSYWAGFIAADGYLNENKNVLQINLSSVEIHERYFSDRSFFSVEKKIVEMGLLKRPQPQISWTKEENESFILAVKDGLTSREIHDTIFPYRTYSSVRNQRNKINRMINENS